MDSKYLLIRGVSLLYIESLLTNSMGSSGPLVLEVANYIETPEVNIGVPDSERDMLLGLKGLCMYMSSQPPDTKFIPSDIIQRVHLFVNEDEFIINSLKEIIETQYSDDDIRLLSLTIRRELNEYVRDRKAKEIILDIAKKIKFKPGELGAMQNVVMDLRASLEVYESNSKEKDPAIVATLSLTNLQNVIDIYNQAKELNDEKGIMKTGLQGLNRMLQGGIRRGYEVVCGALQHNFKTGFSMTIYKQIALYNKPYMIDEKKKPLLLSISFEDHLHQNLSWLYSSLYENEFNEKADIKNTPVEEIAKYVMEKMRVNGYEIEMLHVNPSLWTYRDIQDTILAYEAMGYEIHFLRLDYLPMIQTTGCNENGPIGSAIRDLYRRLRNFCAARKIALYTPHQLSTEAKMLIRNGLEEEFVREIANKGYYDGCKTIDQEVDLEIYIHIVEIDGKKWLCVQRGKHRGMTEDLPAEAKYIVLPFEKLGAIRDDINGADTTRKRPGGNPVGSKEGEKPYWMV